MAIITEHRPSTEERLSLIEGALPHLATKADVAESEARIIKELAGHRAGMAKDLAEHRAEMAKDLAQHRAEMAKSETRIIRWTVAAFGIAIAAITILDRLLG